MMRTALFRPGRVRELLLWSVAIAVLLVVAMPAAGAFAATDPSHATLYVMAEDGVDKSALDGTGNHMQYWPLYRWAPGISSFMWIGDFSMSTLVAALVQNGINGTAMAIGTAIWQVGAWALDFAMGFEFMNFAGETIDNVAAAVGTGIIDSWLLQFVVVVIAIFAIIQAARSGRNPMSGLLRVLSATVIVAIISVMSLAADDSETVDGVYVPAAGSPGWLVVQSNDFISSFSTALTDVIPLDSMLNETLYPTDGIDASSMHCSVFMSGLSHHANSAETSSGLNATDNSKARLSMVSSVSRLWETSAIPTYKAIQFGNNNPYADKVFCHALDQNSGIDENQHNTVMLTGNGTLSGGGVNGMHVPDGGNIEDKGWMVWAPDNSSNRQANYLAWAACEVSSIDGGVITWKVNSDWDGVYSKDVNADRCNTWWNAATGEDIPDEFDVTASSYVKDTRGNGGAEATNEIRNYLGSLTGDTGPVLAGVPLAFTYVFAALAVMIALCIFAIGIIFSKIMLAFFALMLIFTLIASVFKSEGQWKMVGGAFLQMFGSAIFASFASFIMGLLVMMSTIIASIGFAVLSNMPLIMLVWTGMSPLMAIFALKKLFKALKVPDPLSIKGGKAWADSVGSMGGAIAGGAAAGAAAGGVGQMMARAGAAAATDAAMDKFAGGSGRGRGGVGGVGAGTSVDGGHAQREGAITAGVSGASGAATGENHPSEVEGLNDHERDQLSGYDALTEQASQEGRAGKDARTAIFQANTAGKQARLDTELSLAGSGLSDAEIAQRANAAEREAIQSGLGDAAALASTGTLGAHSEKAKAREEREKLLSSADGRAQLETELQAKYNNNKGLRWNLANEKRQQLVDGTKSAVGGVKALPGKARDAAMGTAIKAQQIVGDKHLRGEALRKMRKNTGKFIGKTAKGVGKAALVGAGALAVGGAVHMLTGNKRTAMLAAGGIAGGAAALAVKKSMQSRQNTKAEKAAAVRQQANEVVNQQRQHVYDTADVRETERQEAAAETQRKQEQEAARKADAERIRQETAAEEAAQETARQEARQQWQQYRQTGGTRGGQPNPFARPQ